MPFPFGFKRTYAKRVDPLSFFNEKKFQARYRLSKEVVRILVQKYVATRKKKVLRGVHAVQHRIRFCIALRYFATGSNYGVIGDCHGVSKSIVSHSVRDVSEYFRKHLAEYVRWPDLETEKANKAVVFYRETTKPGCFGLVDGTHIAIHCPRGLTEDENQYFCYKGYYSINTMIVCDYDGRIIHVNASNPGSCNDIYVFNGSQIKFLGERADFKGLFLLGDSGYVLTDYLLTPVRYEQTENDVIYNIWHKKTRSAVERVIGQLKQRWRCLDSSGGYLFHTPYRSACIIESCVALHNVAKEGRCRLLRDHPAPDNFRRIQPPIDQPDNIGGLPRQHFKNLREQYIREWFNPAHQPPHLLRRARARVQEGGQGQVVHQGQGVRRR